MFSAAKSAADVDYKLILHEVATTAILTNTDVKTNIYCSF